MAGNQSNAALSGTIAAEVFLRQLTAETMPPVLCVVGEEAYYQDQVLDKVWSILFDGVPEEERDITVFAEQTDLQQLETQVNTYPFFGGHVVVRITDPQLLNPPQRKEKDKEKPKKQRGTKTAAAAASPQERLQAILSDVPDFATVLIQAEKLDGRRPLTKFLKQHTCYVTCDPITARYLPAWLQKEAALYGGRFTQDAVGAIMEYVETADKEPPLLILEGEVKKIALFAGERKEWNADDVAALFSGLPEAGSFAMNRAIAARNGRELLFLLADQKKRKVSPILLLAKLTAGLRNLARVKETATVPAPVLARELGKSPFVVNMWRRDGARYTARQLTHALWQLDRLTEDIPMGQAGDLEQQYRRLEEILLVLCA
ncbi:MAG: hypothetical protein ACFWT7_08125 [Succiniclasticum sp.]|jgi:DNA polymerase III subunit delta